VTFTPPNTNARLANATTEYDPTVDVTPGGPVQVAYTNYVSSLSTLTQSALETLGVSSINGFNSGRILGSSYCTLTISPSDQVRSSSTAYLDSALKLSNLKVYTQTLVQKIIFNNKTATGVEVQSRGIDYTIHASKEVILSAGAFQSPRLLMVSGVGPSDTLNDLGIDIVADLPGVGQNMWDHIIFGPSYAVSIDTLSAVLKNPTNLIATVQQYATNAMGPLTSPGVEFIGWEKVPAKYRANFSQSTIDDLAQFPSDWPEVKVSFNTLPQE
jgi:choline dehydrogenase